ncbi:22275_t:CDS:2 [Gigaspora margarita]|uniref:22275_t:CDS:1 n=1 Tax=Gigaspora margarita TaxID=4874 RepID=A0ABM8W5A4_GIGMA|nr:22275_t:CDS:2 [Gigaspora margarita]
MTILPNFLYHTNSKLTNPTSETSTCPFTISANKRKDAHGLYLAKFAAPLVEDIVALRPRDIINRVRSEVGAETSYMAAWRSRAANKKRGLEDVDKSYQCIKPQLDNLLIENPGSIMAFEIDTENRFTCAFLCLSPWIKAVEHCRPVFTFDACHSKSSYKGVYFSASAIDGEGKLVPIAFAICSLENSNNWTWFCEYLYKAFPLLNTNETVIISDREKGISDAIQTKLPNAFHAHCVWHIEKNINTKFKTKLVSKIWAAAKALHVKDFDDTMEEISDTHAEATVYLNEIPPATWTWSKCPRNRFGHLTSNTLESLNSWLHDERLVEPFEAIVLYVRRVNTLFYDRRTAYSSMQTILPPATAQRLQSIVNERHNRTVYQISESLFEVKSNQNGFCVVDLTLLTCTCQQFQEYRFPCIHACAAILKTGQQPSQFTHITYHTNTLRNIYKEPAYPVDAEMCFPDNKTLTPYTIKQAGRPRKTRLCSRFGESLVVWMTK